MNEQLSVDGSQFRNSKWKSMSEISPDDTDIYAYDEDGTLLQKSVTFRNGEALVSWDPIDTTQPNFCLAPSASFQECLADHADDPRSTLSDLSVWKQFHGHPDERISGKFR